MNFIKITEMIVIVFDLFIDIKSIHEFHIYFSNLLTVSQNRILIMIEVPVS